MAILDSTVDHNSCVDCYDLLKVYNESTPDNRLDFSCPSIEFIMRHQEYPQVTTHIQCCVSSYNMCITSSRPSLIMKVFNLL